MGIREFTFDEFCYKLCDKLYLPNLPDHSQSTGYHLLKKMVIEDIEPVSLEEMKRWESNPTFEEKATIPDIKYLRFLHQNLRPVIIEYWCFIKKMKI